MHQTITVAVCKALQNHRSAMVWLILGLMLLKKVMEK